MTFWNRIDAAISAATGRPFSARERTGMGGGCINAAYQLEGTDQRYFVKLNHPDKDDMFAAEAAGLEEIIASETLRAPRPVCWGRTEESSYLVLEFIDLTSCTGAACESMGRQLAQMHRHRAPRYGWVRDNTIGSTPQPNAPHSDWVTFWSERRLGFQLELAARNGHGGHLQKKGERLVGFLSRFFEDYAPFPSLLHGDLWGGNCGTDMEGQPVVFDPAVYYGDREADLAMTELFGPFPSRFYGAYGESFPLDPGYKVRKTLYNLYHVLNHANLFGGGYPAQALSMTERLLSEVR